MLEGGGCSVERVWWRVKGMEGGGGKEEWRAEAGSGSGGERQGGGVEGRGREWE